MSTTTTRTAPTGAPSAGPDVPSQGRSSLVQLVAQREVSVRVRDKAFLLSTGFLLLVVLASVLVPLAVERFQGRDTYTVATVGGPAEAVVTRAATIGDQASREGDDAAGIPTAGLTAAPARDVAAAERAVEDGTADVALVPESDTFELVGASSVPADVSELVTRALSVDRLEDTLAGTGVAPDAVRQALDTAAPAERFLQTDGEQRGVATVVGLVFSLLFFLTVFSFGMTIASSVTEEKQSRIVELLVTAVPVRSLLVGKILGNAALAMGQVVLLLAVGLAGASIAGQSALVSVLLRSSGWFLLFFVLGFVMLSCLWAAAGALATRQEDLNSTTLPLQVLVMGPFFASVYVFEPGRWMTILSYVPFSAPLMMPRRIAVGDASWWEIALSLGIVVATAALIVVIGTRLYENSLLRTRSKVAWREAWRRAD